MERYVAIFRSNCVCQFSQTSIKRICERSMPNKTTFKERGSADSLGAIDYWLTCALLLIWLGITKCFGSISSRSEPTAEKESMTLHPTFFNAAMFARELTSEGFK
jgi:hypothetical protein